MEIVLYTDATRPTDPATRLAALARELGRRGAAARLLVAGADDLALRRLRKEAPGISIRPETEGIRGADLVVADFALGAERLATLRCGHAAGTTLLARVPALALDRDDTGALLGFDGALAGTPLVRDFLVVRRRVPAAWTFPAWAERLSPGGAGVAADFAPVVIGGTFDESNADEAADFLRGIAARRGDLVVALPLPAALREELEAAGVTVDGPASPKRLRELFSGAAAAIHLPSRPYPGARSAGTSPFPFEALAAGVPLVSLPWEEPQHPLARGRDFVEAEDADSADEALRRLADSPAAARELAARGRTAAGRHTAARRADRLLAIAAELGAPLPVPLELPAAIHARV